mmetsp:Transcript_25584/g.67016  ORF Transcript_25584/g.67016 Transcript_25584/m.67016 type:complete len:488 (-) Transcript_25584:1142-2605(-)
MTVVLAAEPLPASPRAELPTIATCPPDAWVLGAAAGRVDPVVGVAGVEPATLDMRRPAVGCSETSFRWAHSRSSLVCAIRTRHSGMGEPSANAVGARGRAVKSMTSGFGALSMATCGGVAFFSLTEARLRPSVKRRGGGGGDDWRGTVSGAGSGNLIEGARRPNIESRFLNDGLTLRLPRFLPFITGLGGRAGLLDCSCWGASASSRRSGSEAQSAAKGGVGSADAVDVGGRGRGTGGCTLGVSIETSTTAGAAAAADDDDDHRAIAVMYDGLSGDSISSTAAGNPGLATFVGTEGGLIGDVCGTGDTASSTAVGEAEADVGRGGRLSSGVGGTGVSVLTRGVEVVHRTSSSTAVGGILSVPSTTAPSASTDSVIAAAPLLSWRSSVGIASWSAVVVTSTTTSSLTGSFFSSMASATAARSAGLSLCATESEAGCWASVDEAVDDAREKSRTRRGSAGGAIGGGGESTSSGAVSTPTADAYWYSGLS